jgi:hypothetical protein
MADSGSAVVRERFLHRETWLLRGTAIVWPTL